MKALRRGALVLALPLALAAVLHDEGKKVESDIRAAGGVVDHGMALFYYGIFREAEARFANGKVQLHHIATWRQVLEVARAQALFDEAKLASVQSFLDDPLGWSAAHGGVSALPTT